MLYILGQDGAGGSELQSKKLLLELVRRGVAVDLRVLEGKPTEPYIEGATYYGLTRSPSLENLRRWAYALVSLAGDINSGVYDAVHATMARAYVLAPLLRVNRRSKMVAWRRNMGVHLQHSPIARIAERIAACRTDVIICNSREVAHYWTSRGHVDPSKVEIVPNIVEVNQIAVRQSGIPSAVPLKVLSVGGLKPVKRHDLLLEAIARIERECEVTILGDGPQREKLLALASKLGVCLSLPGHKGDPHSYMTDAHIYVQSSDSEGMSNAILEAVAARVPVVTTDTGGARTIFGKAIRAVPTGDASALASAIEEVVGHPERAANNADEARAILLSEFDVDRVISRHLAIYTKAHPR